MATTIKKSTLVFAIVAVVIIIALVLIVIWKKIKANKSDDDPASVVNQVTGGLPPKKQFALNDNLFSDKDGLRLRDKPSTTDSKIIETINKDIEAGQVIMPTDANGWVKVLRDNGHSGWCYSGYCKKGDNTTNTNNGTSVGTVAGAQNMASDWTYYLNPLHW